ncbi:hypothetical protein FAZ78_20280, partial [Cereibacter changlensis]
MTEPQDKPIDLGIYGRDTGLGRLSVAELLAIAVGLVWVAGVTGYALTTPAAEGEGGPLATLMTVLVVVLPLALIWAAVATLRAVRTLREEAKRLQAAVDAMRNAYVASQPDPGRRHPAAR